MSDGSCVPGCGACCERIIITLNRPGFTAAASTSGGVGTGSRGDHPAGIQRRLQAGGAYARDAAFILRWMRPTGDVVREGPAVKQVWTCDAFDPVHRVCTQHATRPQMCSGYPWYGRDPAGGGIRDDQCGYWRDVPPADRPPNARPLLPLTVL